MARVWSYARNITETRLIAARLLCNSSMQWISDDRPAIVGVVWRGVEAVSRPRHGTGMEAANVPQATVHP
jgi:hypothetical protein